MSQIKIKNFGPIKSGLETNHGFIDIKKVTTFIGNQGSGKSSVAKLISTMTWLEKGLNRGDLSKKEVETPNRLMNNYCKYQGLDNYFQPNTEIEYHGDAYSFHFRNGNFSVTVGSNEQNYKMPKIMYIPAERNFVSAVSRPDRLKGLPSPLLTFLTEYEKAQDALKSNIRLPINNVEFEYDKLNKVSNISDGTYKIRLTQASSGFQSAAPLFIVSQFLANYVSVSASNATTEISAEEQKRIRDQVNKIFSNPNLNDEIKRALLEAYAFRLRYTAFINIVEELEQNLYPSSQRNILNSLLGFANKNVANKLILTTHSPYIINYITLAIKGESVLQMLNKKQKINTYRGKLEEVVPIDSCIPAKESIIYQIDSKGIIVELPTYKGLPSDTNYLNEYLEMGNELFDKLLEIEDLCR